jgi:hypothetical protein
VILRSESFQNRATYQHTILPSNGRIEVFTPLIHQSRWTIRLLFTGKFSKLVDMLKPKNNDEKLHATASIRCIG